jgi:hypothetical protein
MHLTAVTASARPQGHKSLAGIDRRHRADRVRATPVIRRNLVSRSTTANLLEICSGRFHYSVIGPDELAFLAAGIVSCDPLNDEAAPSKFQGRDFDRGHRAVTALGVAGPPASPAQASAGAD